MTRLCEKKIFPEKENGLFKKIILAAMLTAFSLSNAQETREIELQAQEILSRVDDIMRYPEGELKGKVMHLLPGGKSYSFSITGKIAKEDFLFNVHSFERGEQYKILYNLGGEDIWVYNVLSVQMFHKIGIDKFDPVMGTNLSYIDISNYDLQSNYTAKIDGNALVKGIQAVKLTLIPIFQREEGMYGKLTLFVRRSDYYPLRIDFHDRDKVIMKTMSIVQGAEFSRRKFPVRYDVLDIRKGSQTILNFLSLDEKVNFDPRIFRHEELPK